MRDQRQGRAPARIRRHVAGRRRVRRALYGARWRCAPQAPLPLRRTGTCLRQVPRTWVGMDSYRGARRVEACGFAMGARASIAWSLFTVIGRDCTSLRSWCRRWCAHVFLSAIALRCARDLRDDYFREPERGGERGRSPDRVRAREPERPREGDRLPRPLLLACSCSASFSLHRTRDRPSLHSPYPAVTKHEECGGSPRAHKRSTRPQTKRWQCDPSATSQAALSERSEFAA